MINMQHIASTKNTFDFEIIYLQILKQNNSHSVRVRLYTVVGDQKV